MQKVVDRLCDCADCDFAARADLHGIISVKRHSFWIIGSTRLEEIINLHVPRRRIGADRPEKFRGRLLQITFERKRSSRDYAL
jgi:hypothetical protein